MRKLGGDFDAAEEVEFLDLRFVGGVGATGDGVVVGEGERCQIALPGESDDVARS